MKLLFKITTTLTLACMTSIVDAGAITTAPNAGTGISGYAPAAQSIESLVLGSASDLYVNPVGIVHNPGGCPNSSSYALNRLPPDNGVPADNQKYDIYYSAVMASYFGGKKLRVYVSASKCINGYPELLLMQIVD